MELSRGEIRNATLPGGEWPVVVVTRDGAIPALDFVTVAPVTETIHDLPTEARSARRTASTPSAWSTATASSRCRRAPSAGGAASATASRSRQFGDALRIPLRDLDVFTSR